MSNVTPPSDSVQRPPEASVGDVELRRQAIKHLEDKRGLMAHVVAYVTVNALIIAIWFASGRGFFWPLFPLLGWGIGLTFHTWGVFYPEPDEARIAREVDRLRHRHT